MSVLVYTESENGKLKKAAFEATSYAKGIADKMDTSVTAVSVNAEDTSDLGKYGVSKVLKVNNDIHYLLPHMQDLSKMLNQLEINLVCYEHKLVMFLIFLFL